VNVIVGGEGSNGERMGWGTPIRKGRERS